MIPNMRRNRIYYILSSIFPALLLAFATGCSEEITQESGKYKYDDMPVTISAVADGDGYVTRAGDPEKVESREMLFIYPSQPTGEMKSAICVFDDQGYGYVYADSEQKSLLRWKDIHLEQGKCELYLDNLANYPVRSKEEVDYLNYKPDNFSKIEFLGEDLKNNHLWNLYCHKPMIAWEGDEVAALEKDIIWGKLSIPEDTEAGKSLHFKLVHKCAKITFRFYSDDEEIMTQLGGDDIKVWWDKISVTLRGQYGDITNPNSTTFNRQTGKLKNQGGGNETKIYLVGTDVKMGLPSTDANLIKNGGYPGFKGLEIPQQLVQNTMGEGNRICWDTPAWIYPPNNSIKNTLLTLQLGENQYSGKLPDKLIYWRPDQDGNLHPVEEQIGLKQGYHLVIKVKVNSSLSERELLFQGVEVVPWVQSHRENIDVSESGIYTWDDLLSLTELFNTDSSKTNYRLMRYGRWDESKEMWKFKLWKDIKVAASMEIPKFDSDNFEIDFFKLRTIQVGEEVINATDYKEKLVRK